MGEQIRLKMLQDLAVYEKQRIDETTDRIVEWYGKITETGERPVINIDDIGLGGGVTDNLIRKGFPVNGINVGVS